MTLHHKMADRMARFTFFLFCALVGVSSCFQASAQKFVVAPFNFNVKNGFYTPASTDAKALAKVKAEVPAQTFMPDPEAGMWLVYPPQQGILLFRTKELKELTNVAGKLMSPSMAIVDTIFYNQVYLQKDADGGKYSFDMCYSLRIDGKRYYTDFRPHDLAAFRQELPHHKQLLLLASQDTGYEVYADKGYPEHFHIAVFDRQNGGLKTRFISEELPFRYGYEFLDQSDNAIKSRYNDKDRTFHIAIQGLSENYKGVWDGKVLKHLE
ncbi:hypothetical protein [Dyadobacter fermentans]|nr:hypothetical protein [Dyadobacter fermentans]